MTQPLDRRRCEEIVSRLWPYLDGALAASERERVVAHLVECTGCRSHHDFAQAFLQAVRDAAPAGDGEAYGALRTRVTAALAGAAPEAPEA